MEKIFNEYVKYFRFFIIFMGIFIVIFFAIRLLTAEYDSAILLFILMVIYLFIFFNKIFSFHHFEFDKKGLYLEKKKIEYNDITSLKKGKITLKSGNFIRISPFYSKSKFELLKKNYNESKI
jgi:hypothetical protein